MGFSLRRFLATSCVSSCKCVFYFHHYYNLYTIVELKHYQQNVISDFDRYLSLLVSHGGRYASAYHAFWSSSPFACPVDNARYTEVIAGVPQVCFKVPTAGGKTFIACHAVHSYFASLKDTLGAGMLGNGGAELGQGAVIH